jgi:two-component system, OmpR family, response regulator ChvI
MKVNTMAAGGNVRKRILVVDDEEDITAVLKTGLERKGFSVDTYNDPKKALANVKPNWYDIAIFDIRMPGMDGFELYRQFKKLDGGTDVCFFTAFDVYEKEFERMFPKVEVKALFKKPMTIDELAKRLDSILEGAQSLASPRASA